MSVPSRLKEVVQDPLFWRVTVCFIGLPFIYLGVAGVIELSPPEGWWWLGVALLGALGLYGAFLVYAACLGGDRLFERAIAFIHEGGDLIALVFIVLVGLIAIPVTMLLRLVHPRAS